MPLAVLAFLTAKGGLQIDEKMGIKCCCLSRRQIGIRAELTLKSLQDVPQTFHPDKPVGNPRIRGFFPYQTDSGE